MSKSVASQGIASAFAHALKDMRGPAKDGLNPRFGQGYATLGAFIDAVKPTLAAHDLVMHHDFVPTETGDLLCYTVISSTSGDSLRLAPIPIHVDPQNPQATGSAITYARRYSLSAALGIVADEDDDANEASPKPPEKRVEEARNTHPKKAPGPSGEFVDPDPDASKGRLEARVVRVEPPREGKKGQAVILQTANGLVRLGAFEAHLIDNALELVGSSVAVQWKRSKDGKWLNLVDLLHIQELPF